METMTLIQYCQTNKIKLNNRSRCIKGLALVQIHLAVFGAKPDKTAVTCQNEQQMQNLYPVCVLDYLFNRSSLPTFVNNKIRNALTAYHDANRSKNNESNQQNMQ